MRSGLHLTLTSSWCVQSWRSHSFLLHRSRPGSFPVQLTSSKRMGPDPTPKRGTGLMSSPSERRVSPNLVEVDRYTHPQALVFFLFINVDILWCVRCVHEHITCNQVVDKRPACLSLSSHRHTRFPSDHGKRLLSAPRICSCPLTTLQNHLGIRTREKERSRVRC